MKRTLIATVILLISSFLIVAVWKIFFTCHCTSKADTILNCLFEVDEAKIQWVKDHPNSAGTTLDWRELAPYCQDFWKRPVAGEIYRINKIGEPPSAVVGEKVHWIPRKKRNPIRH